MRFFSFIMAFLFLALSVLPCADDSFIMKPGKAKTEISHSHQDSDEHEDACSPFCHCTCCASFSINHLFSASSSLTAFDVRSYSSYLPGDPIKFSIPVWQPPKIG